MNYLDWLSAGSEAHEALKIEGGLAIKVIDSSLEALERFQPVAREAFERQSAEGYEIRHEHKTSRFPGDLYDMLVLVFKEPTTS